MAIMNRYPILFVTVLLAALLGGPSRAGGPASGAPAPGREQSFTLRLGGYAFDPLEGRPLLPAGWDRVADRSPDLHLVQFDGPIPSGARKSLRAGGVEVVQYIHPNTYIVWGRGEQVSALERRSEIRWTGGFVPAFRVLPRWREIEAAAVEVDVLVYRGARPDVVLRRIELLGARLEGRRAIHEKLEIARFTLPGRLIQQVASISGVYSVQLAPEGWESRAEASAQISAGNLDGGGLPLPGYESWLAGLGLDGSGVIVANVDEGLDETHPDLIGRMLPCSGETCGGFHSHHGTHTAGIIAGDASSDATNDDGFLLGLGVAPGANLIEQSYLPAANEPGGIPLLLADSSRNGANVSSNSWGTSGLPRGYDATTLMVDQGVRDADPDTPGNQSLVYIQAVNNGDGGTSTQGSPDEAKNVISVGSTKALHSSGNLQPDIDSLSDNSAHGPALDGRILPHLVAPGCFTISTGPPDSPEDPHGWGMLCGTSMAAPNVAGAAALFIERYRGLPGFVKDPSPALVKAALLAAARDLEGDLDADGSVLGHRPDSKQGWGRLDLAAAIDPPADSVLYFDEPIVFDFNEEATVQAWGQDWTRQVVPVDPAQPMRVVLSWTDAPGHGLGGDTPALSNDLDLLVELDGAVYRGNNFGPDGLSDVDGSADQLENTEAVFVTAALDSDMVIRVIASNINSDGVPGVGDESDQDFALVCHNCALVPGFALTTAPSRRETCSPASADYPVRVEQILGYNSSVSLSVADVPAGAGESFSENPVFPGATPLLSIDPGSALPGDYSLRVYGDSIDMQQYTTIALGVRTAAPAPALMTSPADAAVDVPLYPLLEWDPDPLTTRYLVEVATDPAFENIVRNAFQFETSFQVDRALDRNTVYYWRVRGTNACGWGSFATPFSFTTFDTPRVLLVDDDYDLPDSQADWTDSLTNLGVAHDVWDVWGTDGDGSGEPTLANLVPYDRVIWYSNEEEIYAGPSKDGEFWLERWLDQAGCYFLSSRDYRYSRGSLSPFMQERLGVASILEDTDQAEVAGLGTVFGGLGPYALKNDPNGFRDSVTPDGTAELAFRGDENPPESGVYRDAGVNKDAGVYRTAFVGIDLENLFDAQGREDFLSAFLGWCDTLGAVDGDGDLVANEADCEPADPEIWGPPSEVVNLWPNKVGGTDFKWDPPTGGSTGVGSTYDLLRSRVVDDFYQAECAATNVNVPEATDSENPEVLETFFYLVRSKNSCGSTLGSRSDGEVWRAIPCD
jgi:hypothetical protein